MDSQLTHMWVNFFSAAGIPSDVGAIYALTFAENRIQNDMLLDLNKEYLRDMGITRMGDVIAILRHAKTVHESSAREKILGPTTSKVPMAAVTGRITERKITEKKSSSPVSRIVGHYTRNVTSVDSPKTSPTHAANRLKRKTIQFNEPLEAKKSRDVSTAMLIDSATTVFSRLGTNGTETTTSTQSKKIYDRLGSKTDENVTTPETDDVLEYAGILKGPSTLKNVTVTTGMNVRKIAICEKMKTTPLPKFTGTMRADEPHVSAKEKLNLKTKSVQFSQDVQYKVIKPQKKNDFQIFNKPERRLSMPELSEGTKDEGIKHRLGFKNKSNDVNTRVNKSVFNRLGH